MPELAEVRMLDRIERLIRKNAALLGEHVRIGATLLPDGRVQVGYLPGLVPALFEGSDGPPRVYGSIGEAYRAAIRSHRRAHVEHAYREMQLRVPGPDTVRLQEHLRIAGARR